MRCELNTNRKDRLITATTEIGLANYENCEMYSNKSTVRKIKVEN